jgi:hypothetical protein
MSVFDNLVLQNLVKYNSILPPRKNVENEEPGKPSRKGIKAYPSAEEPSAIRQRPGVSKRVKKSI